MNLFMADKPESMKELRDRARTIVPEACEPERNMVWGDGSIESPLVIIGEAPGEQEDKQQKPFVGPAGALLDRELARVGISREHIYITNIVKCRPTQPGTGKRLTNRAPRVAEVRAWMPFLMEELEIIGPRIMLCAGGTAAKWLLKKDFSITKERGEWMEGPVGTIAIATYHPAYILRLMGPIKDQALVAFRQDLDKVRSRLEELGEMRRVAA